MRIEKLRQAYDVDVQLVHFPLHPETPAEGMTLEELFAGRGNPAERVARAVEFGAQVHPQYRREFDNGISVAWHRVPWALGCAGMWTDATRQRHYDDLCAVDGRIVLAGEHASHLPAWQEGAILSSLDAISRLHARAVAAPKGQS